MNELIQATDFQSEDSPEGEFVYLLGARWPCGGTLDCWLRRRASVWAISFTPVCLCLSVVSLKAVGPIYLVSLPGEIKIPRVFPTVDSISLSHCIHDVAQSILLTTLQEEMIE